MKTVGKLSGINDFFATNPISCTIGQKCTPRKHRRLREMGANGLYSSAVNALPKWHEICSPLFEKAKVSHKPKKQTS
jgi:hypothetical protein